MATTTTVSWLPPEPSSGPVEYKRQVVPRDNTRRERLETQMRYRLDEGQGRALYELGVEDDGACLGVPLHVLDTSEAELRALAQACNATVSVLTRVRCADGPPYVSLDTDAAAAAAAGSSAAKSSSGSSKKGSNGGEAGGGPPLTPEEAAICKDLMKRRDAARAVKNWPLADQLRSELNGLGLNWRSLKPASCQKKTNGYQATANPLLQESESSTDKARREEEGWEGAATREGGAPTAALATATSAATVTATTTRATTETTGESTTTTTTTTRGAVATVAGRDAATTAATSSSSAVAQEAAATAALTAAAADPSVVLEERWRATLLVERLPDDDPQEEEPQPQSGEQHGKDQGTSPSSSALKKGQQKQQPKEASSNGGKEAYTKSAPSVECSPKLDAPTLQTRGTSHALQPPSKAPGLHQKLKSTQSSPRLSPTATLPPSALVNGPLSKLSLEDTGEDDMSVNETSNGISTASATRKPTTTSSTSTTNSTIGTTSTTTSATVTTKVVEGSAVSPLSVAEEKGGETTKSHNYDPAAQDRKEDDDEDDDEDEDTAGRSAAEVLGQEVRVAVCGNVDAGKSTCVGCLAKHKLDDGRGSLRSSVMRFPHEIETGRTSAVVQHTVFERPDGSGRRLTLVDLAGHEKYLRTTIYGFNSGLVDVALVLVNARKGPLGTTKHHLDMAAVLGVPVVIALSKVDACPPDVLATTGKALGHMLKQVFPGGTPKPLKRLLPEHEGGPHPEGPPAAKLEDMGRALPGIIPVLPVSFVTGEGVERLRRFVFALSVRADFSRFALQPLEFVSDGLYMPPGAGIVLSGFVLRGTVVAGQSVLVGPRPDTTFIVGTVRSVHRDRTLHPDASAGQACCLAVVVAKDQRAFLRRGMAVLAKPLNYEKLVANKDKVPVYKEKDPIVTASAGAGTAAGTVAGTAAAAPPPPFVPAAIGVWEFEARLFVVRGSAATLRVGYEPYAHIVMVRQSVKILRVTVERSDPAEADVADGDKKDKTGKSSETITTKKDTSAESENGNNSSISSANGIGSGGNGSADSADTGANRKVMHSGDVGVVKFRFLWHPEYVRPGMRVMLREGRMRSVGEVL